MHYKKINAVYVNLSVFIYIYALLLTSVKFSIVANNIHAKNGVVSIPAYLFCVQL